jgi:arylsulfatase A-like enzyme
MPVDAARGWRAFLVRALLWGVAWGAGAGAIEAVAHLTSWQLFATPAQARQFFIRSVVYGVGYFALCAVGIAAVSLAWRRVRRDVGAHERAAGVAWVAAAVATAGSLLYGIVTWRVGYHINDPWTSPALVGGIALVIAGSGLLWLAIGLVAGRLERWLRLSWLAPLPVVAVLFTLVPTLIPGAGASTAPVRVLFITLDTVRADRIGALGGPVDTPTLDALAARGVLFEQAVAQAPITCPAHLSLLSSTPPTTNGVFANGTRIPDDLPLLQESFRAAGIPTAAFVAGYPVTTRFGFDRGFDVFDDDFSEAFGDHRLTVRRLLDQGIYARGAPRERIADAVIERARPWLEGHAEQGFFCWVHLFDPHGPYEAPAPFGEALAGPLPDPAEGPEMPSYWPSRYREVTDTAYWTERYHEEIRYTDDRLGLLLGMLEEFGVLDQTLVVVVADHGESLTEHEYYFEHGLHLYDASLRIPMLMAGPGVGRGERVPCQVRGMDLAPTVLELIGMTAPETFEGQNLRPLWEVGCPADLRLSIAATVEPPWLPEPGAELALRTDGPMRFKYVQHRRSDDELYDLLADPDETTEILAEQPVIGARLREDLERASEGMVEVAPALDEDVIEMLRALGYITDGPAKGVGAADDDSGMEGDAP